MLCSYKNILGEPSNGVHGYRIFNIAIVDVLLTIIMAFIIHNTSTIIHQLSQY